MKRFIKYFPLFRDRLYGGTKNERRVPKLMKHVIDMIIFIINWRESEKSINFYYR